MRRGSPASGGPVCKTVAIAPAAARANKASAGTILDLTNLAVGRAAVMRQKTLDGLPIAVGAAFASWYRADGGIEIAGDDPHEGRLAGAVGADERDLRALAGEGARHRRPDAAGGAGNHRHPVAQGTADHAEARPPPEGALGPSAQPRPAKYRA